MRAARIKTWLIENGESSSKVTKTIGHGSKDPAVKEPKLKKAGQSTGATPEQLEAARVLNRRVAVKVVEFSNSLL